MVNGWIILDKPSGITSAHAVAKVKRILSSPSPIWGEGRGEGLQGKAFPVNPLPNPPPGRGRGLKIGHAGTLDPLASGILPLALGEATKTVQFMQDGAKAYGFTVTWGQERDTDDSEGAVVASSDKRPSMAEIQAILHKFTGKIQQTPPDYSAIKMGGKRAYDMARQGEAVQMKGREVEVYALSPSPLAGEGGVGGLAADSEPELVATPHPGPPPQGGREQTSFLCHCGKGTYIRSLARDMGRLLGCYGYISMLRRLKVANFTEAHAISLEQLEEMVHKGELSFLRPVESALDDILAWDISSDQAIRLRRGQTLVPPAGIPDETVMLARCDGHPVAICRLSLGSVKTVRVFNL